MASIKEETKKKWTDQERLDLATELDAKLDEFIDGLEKTRYTEGWPEDRWQEEMDKHPFFMKQAPKPGDEVHPMFEGLQNLKYDPAENTSDELAQNYKEDGNFYMKFKKFRMAIFSFSEGIKIKDQSDISLATLFNNRSAAHYFLQNYRSSLIDAQNALKLKKDYEKAMLRAAKCAFELKRFDLCTQLSEALLEKNSTNMEITNLLTKNKQAKIKYERDQRKEEADLKKKTQQFYLLWKILEKRKIKFDNRYNGEHITPALLKPTYEALQDFPVHLDEFNEQNLIWPALFYNKDTLLVDYYQQLDENLPLEVVLKELLSSEEKHAIKGNPSLNDYRVYYENHTLRSVHRVNIKKKVRDIIAEQTFVVRRGCLMFYLASAFGGKNPDYKI